MNKYYYIETFGCQMNVHESEKLAGLMEERGLVLAPAASEADVIIFNTHKLDSQGNERYFQQVEVLEQQSQMLPSKGGHRRRKTTGAFHKTTELSTAQ